MNLDYEVIPLDYGTNLFVYEINTLRIIGEN